MMATDLDVGQRVAMFRARRGLTQEELAGLAGISLSFMKKIESGERAVTKFALLVRLAAALGVDDLRELTGVPLPLAPTDGGRHPATAEVRAALLDYSLPGTAPELDDLGTEIEAAWSTWHESSPWRYANVGQRLPTLIRSARAAEVMHQGSQHRRARREASKLYLLVRTWTKRVGECELSLLAADRAATSAREADDPDLSAAASWNVAMVLSAEGHTSEARAVVRRAIEVLRPRVTDGGRRRMAVYGALHLLGAAEAARAHQPGEVRRLADVAATIAERTGETTYYRMMFGPTNVALYRVTAAVEMGRISDAITVAERLSLESLPSVERRLTGYLDTARCYAVRRNDIGALHMLQRVRAASIEELRYNRTAHAILDGLESHAKPSIRSDLVPLREAAGLPG